MILQKFLVKTKPGLVAHPAESLTMPIFGGLPVTIHRRDEFFNKTKLATPEAQKEEPAAVTEAVADNSSSKL